MRESQYVESYLDSLIPYTPGTFIAYTVRGTARAYANRYVAALVNALERREARGEVVRTRSVRGGVAWRRA